MSLDPFAELKQRQREMWASFGPTALFTTPVAGHVVRFAGIVAGETVLDVGTGTGVLAISAARLGDRFGPPFFERGVMKFSALSIPHFRLFMERSVGPIQKLVASMAADPQRLERFQDEFEALAAPYHFDNVMHQDYLLTRAQVA